MVMEVKLWMQTGGMKVIKICGDGWGSVNFCPSADLSNVFDGSMSYDAPTTDYILVT